MAEPAAKGVNAGKRMEKNEPSGKTVSESGNPKAPEKDTPAAGTGEASKGPAVTPEKPLVDSDDSAAAENAEAVAAAVARPVSPDLVQIYGWREYIRVKGVTEKLKAKLDTGALTSSIHAEEKELFERDGKKWVRFVVTDPSVKKPVRTRVEAPLVRIARIKEPGSKSVPREVVRLSFRIGARHMRGEFTLNNRANMLSPVLIGRSTIKNLGWVDSGRTYLADKKIFR